jgi:hypothetical protein
MIYQTRKAGSGGKSAHLSEFHIRWYPMITSTVYVERHQVGSIPSLSLEQVISDFHRFKP